MTNPTPAPFIRHKRPLWQRTWVRWTAGVFAALAHPPGPVSVEIPGQFYAHYQDGEVVKWVFLPLASYAGYFGPAAQILAETGHEDLDVESTDGPFWQAVRKTGDAAGWSLTVKWEE